MEDIFEQMSRANCPEGEKAADSGREHDRDTSVPFFETSRDVSQFPRIVELVQGNIQILMRDLQKQSE